jgi:hypothetical protein
MDYEVTTARDARFLRVTALGAYGLQLTKNLFDRVAADANQYEANRVLIDMRGVAGRVTTMDRYEMGVHAASRFKIRVALVGRSDMIDHFGETVAINRGVKGRVFIDEAEALSWLLSDKGPMDRS